MSMDVGWAGQKAGEGLRAAYAGPAGEQFRKLERPPHESRRTQMKTLSELNPQWWQLYRDRHLTPDNGGFPTDEHELIFTCPACGPPYRILVKFSLKPADEKQHRWQANVLPDGMTWPDRLTLIPSINNVNIGHGRKRLTCSFHGMHRERSNSAMNPDRKTLADWIEANGESYFNLEFGIGKEERHEQIKMIVAALRSPVAGEIADRARSLDHRFNELARLARGFLPAEVAEIETAFQHTIHPMLFPATPPTGESEIKPHLYSPSHQAMGDCLVCGHVQNKPWHTGESAPASDNLADAREFCVGAFGPLGVNIEPYVKIIVELMDGAVARYKRNACTSAGESAPDVGEDYKDDPTSDERWNAGLDFGMQQFCKALDVDPEKVTWDAATETVDGDVQAVIWNILRTRFGDDWDPDASPSAGNEIQSSED